MKRQSYKSTLVLKRVVFFFLRKRRPPRSPLFPYPTLFRSGRTADQCPEDQRQAADDGKAQVRGEPVAPRAAEGGDDERREPAKRREQRHLGAADDLVGHIGRAHVCTPVTPTSPIPSSPCNT